MPQESDFPHFDKVKPEHVVPAMKALLEALHNGITELEQNVKPTWAGLIEPLERLTDRHSIVWGVVSHLKGVQDSEDLRKVSRQTSALHLAPPAFSRGAVKARSCCFLVYSRGSRL